MCPRIAAATINAMQTTVHEIADGVYRLSTCVPEVAPGGFTFNQYLLDGDEPLLFHTGPRRMFPLVSEAVGKVIPVDRLRWVSFGHVEADECGAMNAWLAAAPYAEVLFNALGCMVSLDDLADRPPVPVTDDGARDIGGHRIRTIATPHVPHGWEAQVMLRRDHRHAVLRRPVHPAPATAPALVHDADLVEPALAAEDLFGATCPDPGHGARRMRALADLEPRTLALMHGPAFAGDWRQALRELADAYEARFAAAVPV